MFSAQYFVVLVDRSANTRFRQNTRGRFGDEVPRLRLHFIDFIRKSVNNYIVNLFMLLPERFF
jgi:hypothetical protein